MNAAADLPERVVALESTVMHLEHNLEAMHEVLLAQGREITTLRGQVEKLQRRLGRLEGRPEGQEEPPERPPHY